MRYDAMRCDAMRTRDANDTVRTTRSRDDDVEGEVEGDEGTRRRRRRRRPRRANVPFGGLYLIDLNEVVDRRTDGRGTERDESVA